MNLQKMPKDAFKLLKKHSPAILTGVGIVGFFTTVVTAVQATPKALKLIEERKKELELEKLSAVETVKTTWKCYIPSAITAAASTACIVGASSTAAKRNAALVTAYTITETAAKEYRNKVVETIGEKKEETIRDSIAKDKIEKNPVSKQEVIRTGNGSTKCYDPWNDRYFESDPETIRSVINDLNYQMLNEQTVTLNDFYYLVGLSGSKTGEIMGWNIDDDGQIQIHFSAQLDDKNEPCLVVDFINPPSASYSLF